MKTDDYDYLLRMPLWSLTWEKVQSLMKDLENKDKELKVLNAINLTDMWINDLKEFLDLAE